MPLSSWGQTVTRSSVPSRSRNAIEARDPATAEAVVLAHLAEGMAALREEHPAD